MAGLKNLIRLHEWTVDERRRELGAHLKYLNELDQALVDLEHELQREQALAGASADGLNFTFGAYYKNVRYRRERFQRQIREKEAEIADARDILSRAYMELKKYQVAQDVRNQAVELEISRRDQNELDELGLQLYRQQQRTP